MKINKSQLKLIIKEEIEEVLDWDAPLGKSVYTDTGPDPDKRPRHDQRRRDAYKDYEPAYHDEVEVDHVKLAADIKSAMKTFTPEQVVDSIVRGLEHIGPAGEEALIALSGVFGELGKPHHRKHQEN